MKKKLILLLFICLMAGNSYGQYSECLTGYPAVKAEYTPIQFSFWPLTIFHHDTNVYGIRLAPGVVHLQGVVWGCSIGGFIATGTHCGLSLSLCQTGYESYGIVGGVGCTQEKHARAMTRTRRNASNFFIFLFPFEKNIFPKNIIQQKSGYVKNEKFIFFVSVLHSLLCNML